MWSCSATTTTATTSTTPAGPCPRWPGSSSPPPLGPGGWAATPAASNHPAGGRAPRWRGAGLRLDRPTAFMLRSRRRDQPAPHHLREERNARRPTCSGPGRFVGVRPPAGLPDAGRARHRGRLSAPPGRPLVPPPSSPPTSGCTRRSDGSPEATAGTARLPVPMLRPTHAQQEIRRTIGQLSEKTYVSGQAPLPRHQGG